MRAEEIHADSSLRHLDGDAEETVGRFAAGLDLAPLYVVKARLAPDAIGACTLALARDRNADVARLLWGAAKP